MKVGDFVTQARRTDWPFVARVERVHPIPSGTDPTHFASIKLEGARGAPEEKLPRTFFHSMNSKEIVPEPIGKVVEWANTAHGGKQMLLLDTEPAGCVRWGLCEAAGDDS